MLNNKTAWATVSLRCFWLPVLTLFFAINMNYDWRTSSLVWYGCLALVCAAYYVGFSARFLIKDVSFITWFVSFVGLGVCSLAWSLSAGTGMDVVKSMVVILAVLLLVQSSANFGFSVDSMLRGFFVAILVNMLYVVSNIDMKELGSIQLGTNLIEGWNGNGIGFMAAQGVLIGCYLFGRSNRNAGKLFYLVCNILLGFLTLYTGSRTAFIMLVLELILYYCLRHPSKMLRNIIISVFVLIGALYLVMTVESFYNVLGSRLEGLFALFSGDGRVDHSSSVRDIFIQNGKEWFLDQPLFGYGINNYKVLNLEATGKFTYAHNNFVELAVDLGIVGLVWYYSVYIYLGVQLLKRLNKSPLNVFLLSALLASLISQYGTVEYYGFYQNYLLCLCFVGINQSRKEKGETYNERKTKKGLAKMV